MTTEAVGQAVSPRVFISYSFDRMRVPAVALAEALRRHGADVVEPASSEVSGNIRDRIAAGIKASDLMIVLVSPGDEVSRWMQLETRLMLETCWQRPDAQIAVVAPAIGAIPPALRHKDFVTYYPHDVVRLENWATGSEADTFASEALSRVDQGPRRPVEPISDRELRRWRNRVVHIGRGELANDVEEHERILAKLEADLVKLRAELGSNNEAIRGMGLEDVIDRMLLANALGHRELFLAYYELAEAVYEVGSTPSPDRATDVGYRLGLAALAAGDVSTALGLLEPAAARRANELGTNHPATIEGWVNVAIAKELLGDLRGAQKSYEDAFEAAQNSLGRFHPQTADIAQRLALLRAATGDRETARALLELAEEAYKHVRPADSPELANIRRYLVAFGSLEEGA